MSKYDMEFVRSRIRAGLENLAPDIDGDFTLNTDMKDVVIENARKPAAVLIGFIERAGEAHMILTKRTEQLKNHSGQIAFPGGKIDEDDASPEAAALREAWEEIGLDTTEVEVLGTLPVYHSGSGYLIHPVLGLVQQEATFQINPDEVEYVFDVPLSFLMNTSNHITASKYFKGAHRHYYEMPYGDHYIWGVTAGMIRVLHDRIFANETA